MIFPHIEELSDEETYDSITFFAEDIDFELPNATIIEQWLLSVAEAEHKSVAEVSYIFCSDDYLLEMNSTYLQHDDYTDVITFPYHDLHIHGDIFISIDRVRDNAQKFEVTFEHELCRVLVHGFLHLMGYEDTTAALKQVMRTKEDTYLNLLPKAKA